MVSVITINYNGWQDTAELIASLKRHETYPYEVIVVDNASRGDDVARLRQAHPDVTIVASTENLGFAGGNNVGLRHAHGDYIFFLNNDMVVKAPMLRALVERLEEKQVGGVSPSIRYLYQPDRIQYYGYCDLTPVTLKHTTPSLDYSRLDGYLHPAETEVLHGGAMMLRRDAISRVGEMAEAYFLFYEEFDYSRRLREAGYRLFYEPASVVYHKESATIPKLSPLREYYQYRARVIYARRNVRGWRKPLACLYQIACVLPKKLLEYTVKRRPDLAVAVFRGCLAGFFARIRG